jgi:hypothetical protein
MKVKENVQESDQDQDRNNRLGKLSHKGKEGRLWEETEEEELQEDKDRWRGLVQSAWKH